MSNQDRFKSQFNRPSTLGDRFYGGPPARQPAEPDYIDGLPVRELDEDAPARVDSRVQMATPKGALAVRGQQAMQTPAVDLNVPTRLEDGTTLYQGYRMTKTGLIPPDDATEAQWIKVGMYLFSLETSIQWWVGDFLDQGDRVWGRSVQSIAEDLGREPQTLYNWVTVCRKFQISRRREKLPFSHHAELIGLPERDQEAWLDMAMDGDRVWSGRELRDAINGGPKPTGVKRTWLDSLQSKLFGNRKKYGKVEYVDLTKAAELIRAELSVLEAEIERRRG